MADVADYRIVRKSLIRFVKQQGNLRGTLRINIDIYIHTLLVPQDHNSFDQIFESMQVHLIYDSFGM